MITFKREKAFHGNGDLITAEVLGIKVQESEALGLTFVLNGTGGLRIGLQFSPEEMQFLLSLILFLGRTAHEGHPPSHLASWLEGYRSGRQNLQSDAFREQTGVKS